MKITTQPSGRTLLLTWLALLVLLALTMLTACFDLGIGNIVINLTIAVIKASLVFWIFMEVHQANPYVKLFAFSGFAWLAILFGLSATDFFFR